VALTAKLVTPTGEFVTPTVEAVTPTDKPVTPRDKFVTPRDKFVTPRAKFVTPRDEPVAPTFATETDFKTTANHNKNLMYVCRAVKTTSNFRNEPYSEQIY